MATSASNTSPAERKDEIRRELRARREDLPAEERGRLDNAIVSFLAARLRALPGTPRLIAAYSPLATEPGGPALLDVLQGEAAQVLLPITGANGKLSWAPYRGAGRMRSGRFDIAEPDPKEARGNEALAECELIVVPTLGLTPDGYRLGKGGGFYDRALAELDALDGPRPEVVALAYDWEVRSDIPTEDHDLPVDAYATQSGFTLLDEE